MSSQPIARRDFVTLAIAFLLAPGGRLGAEPVARRGTFAADVGILYQMMTFHLEGEIHETVDRAAGRYEVRVSGEGDGIANRVESAGRFRDGRWVPLRGASWFQVRGRESRVRVTYDYDQRTIEYHAKGETFFIRRMRVVDDTVALPVGATVDDSISAALNYRDGYWKPGPDGELRTHVVRRRRNPNEGPDDVARVYRAELAPLALKLEHDPASRKASALLDLSRFSSWAREDRPARITFDHERRPALITGSMILGTSLTIRLG
jgi:hypothetical protein